ncbi:hypothetical protein BDW02DRAFT_569612 [Decorospora gaudefroyi]|uniref:Zn(2)-C6 fungal-type domain-containing protein n=1 Tax=Decorospora gaudefroyi TaxID=184978 RepID=A0A6A5KDY2_9PLEO|nr:hypothetical protein BDW02DRAFT_569612 [Decorospora gaudefroyi]
MVYRGRPSTGCKKCRERKIKCDERQDGCIKCADRGVQCPGYDRSVDAFFCDETAHVQARAKKSKAKAIAVRDAKDAHARLDIMTKGFPTLRITASLVDQGISFFMSYYCLGIDQPPVYSDAHRKYLSTDGFHPLVAACMTALGIAGVANLYMDPRLKREATRRYLNAIKMANAAISSPKDAKSDSTLISVNLLSMFEATNNDQTLDGWIKHVDGATSLVKLRGMDQFSTLAGQRMYLQTAGLITMICMGRGKPLPQFIHDMNSEVMKHLDNSDPRNRFYFLHIKTVDFRARILSQELISLADIIETAHELDTIALGIFEDPGPEWNYDVVPCGKDENIFEDFYHIYPAIIAAQNWNWMRYNRIYFHDIVRNSILAGFASSPPTLVGRKYHEQLEESTRILYKLQSEIIASMPQFLHDVPPVAPRKMDLQPGDTRPPNSTPKTSASQATSTSAKSASNYPVAHKTLHQNFRTDPKFAMQRFVGNGKVDDRLPIIRVAGDYSTVWSLYVSAAMPIASPESQDYVYKCLIRMEREFGINQARVLANALQLKRQLDRQSALPFSICPDYLPNVNAELYTKEDESPTEVVVEDYS